MELTRDELFKCLTAVDEYIKRYEMYHTIIDDSWYYLRDKLMKMVRNHS